MRRLFVMMGGVNGDGGGEGGDDLVFPAEHAIAMILVTMGASR